ncbi:PAAR domain-containing protein [Xanthomonas sp. WHRI 1810A]|uniref:PAAR domain-containing protein n=1 Tax=Xanthomonas sp. WHRI 1810A TaxID=3161565 RepID=UPI0032E8A801
MSQGFVLLGDKTSHGGQVITANSMTIINGKKAALVDDLVSCPIPGHGVNPIVEGCGEHIDNGKEVAVNGCQSACGAELISSVSDYVVG